MEKIKELKDKHVAIVGLGISQIDFVLSIENSKTWDEIWGINAVVAAFKCDRMFMLDPASRFFEGDDAGKTTEVMRKILPELTLPIYTCELDERVPAAIEYPLEDVANYSKCAYFNNTVAYAIAFAYWSEVSQIDLFGIDFSYQHNLHFAEAGRACVEFWLCKCMEKGITVAASPRSAILDSNVSAKERLYGYHRLNDPNVAVPHNGHWIIAPHSKLNAVLAEHNVEMMEEILPPEPYKG